MTQTIRHSPTPDPRTGAGAASSAHGITEKGLKGGQLGLLAVVVLGISTIAPAYTSQAPSARPSVKPDCSCR